MKFTICRDCEIEFNSKKSKKGLINQCDECSEMDQTIRTIGFNSGELNKAQSLGLYKGGDKKTIKKLLGHRMV